MSDAAVGIGVLGARSFVANQAVLPAIEASDHARLVALAAAGGPVPEAFTSQDAGSYDAVVDHPDVEAVYIPLPNGLHAPWTERAARAGKHVLCEKPLAPDRATAAAMASACDRAGVLLAEAWMTPFDPRWATVVDRAASGAIGEVTAIDAAFTFTIDEAAAANYRWHADQGGGALLDVGIYCLGPAVELWGPEPDAIDAASTLTDGGVDATTAATLRWSGGRVATIRCSFVEPERQTLTVTGTGGQLHLDGDAHTGGAAAATVCITDVRGTTTTETVTPGDPYRGMVDAFGLAVRGRRPWPRPADRAVAMAGLLDDIRAAAEVAP